MGNVVAQVMKSASFEGYYTNHSLRRTCATRLYDKGLPEQLILKQLVIGLQMGFDVTNVLLLLLKEGQVKLCRGL